MAAVVVVTALGTWSAARVEGDLAERADSALRAAGLGAGVRLEGRDAVVESGGGSAGDVERAAAVVAALPGVRSVRVDRAPVADLPPSPVIPAPETSGPAVGEPADAEPATGDDVAAAPDLVIPFTGDDTDLGDAGRAALDDLAGRLRTDGDLRVRVAGHADGSGGEAANLELSRDLAQVVADHLVSRGVLAARVTTEAYGDTRPVAGDDGSDGRSRNRRVEIVLRETN